MVAVDTDDLTAAVAAAVAAELPDGAVLSGIDVIGPERIDPITWDPRPAARLTEPMADYLERLELLAGVDLADDADDRAELTWVLDRRFGMGRHLAAIYVAEMAGAAA
jgi:hypothetical protein